MSTGLAMFFVSLSLFPRSAWEHEALTLCVSSVGTQNVPDGRSHGDRGNEEFRSRSTVGEFQANQYGLSVPVISVRLKVVMSKENKLLKPAFTPLISSA
jgi:hypothetical protein